MKKGTPLPSLYIVDWVCRALIPIVGPKMMPIVGSKIYVNTHSKRSIVQERLRVEERLYKVFVSF